MARESRVPNNARWVASILRQAAPLRRTSSNASAKVPLRVVIRPLQPLPPSPSTRQDISVLPILALVLSNPRLKVRRVLLRRVPVTCWWVTNAFSPNSGRAREVSVEAINPFGPATSLFIEPAYLVSLSKATDGQKVEPVRPAIQNVRLRLCLVTCMLGWPESTRSGIFIDKCEANRRLKSPFSVTPRGALVSSKDRSPLIRPTRLLKLTIEPLILQQAVSTREMVVLLVRFVLTRVRADLMALPYALVARWETLSRLLSTNNAQHAPVTPVTRSEHIVRPQLLSRRQVDPVRCPVPCSPLKTLSL